MDIKTRTVVNTLKHPDGSIEEIKVTERRPKKRHDSMMRHMENLAAGKKRRAETAMRHMENLAAGKKRRAETAAEGTAVEVRSV